MARYITSGTGQYAVNEADSVILPKNWKADGTQRGIIYCPGFNSNALTQTISPFSVVPYALADAGIPVLSCDFGVGGNQFGNDTSSTRVAAAWTFFKSQFGVKTDKVGFIGGSMGSLTSLNWIQNNLATVSAWAGLIPATDLADLHDNRGFSTQINTAYTNLAGYTAALATHSPIAYTTGSTFNGLPMKMWYSSDDPTVVLSTITAFASVTGAATVNTGAHGHDASFTDPAQVVAFFKANL